MFSNNQLTCVTILTWGKLACLHYLWCVYHVTFRSGIRIGNLSRSRKASPHNAHVFSILSPQDFISFIKHLNLQVNCVNIQNGVHVNVYLSKTCAKLVVTVQLRPMKNMLTRYEVITLWIFMSAPSTLTNQNGPKTSGGTALCKLINCTTEPVPPTGGNGLSQWQRRNPSNVSSAK